MTERARTRAMAARREALAALRHGHRWVARVTWLFRAGAVAYGVVTLVAVMALASPDVPVGGGILVVALSTLVTALMLMGAMQILFQPLEWTVAVASLASLVAVAHLIGPNPLGLASVWSAAWAAVFWAAVAPMLHFRRLTAAHMDLYIAHHASRRTVHSLQGRSPEERHERLLRAMQRASQHAWKVSAAATGVILAASVIGSYWVATQERPRPLADAVLEFETAWNDGGINAVADLFAADTRSRQTSFLTGVIDGHGWKFARPRLEHGHERHEEASVWVDYKVQDMTIASRWTRHGTSWRLLQLVVPPPPYGPSIKRFVAAWGRSDVPAIAAMFSPDHRDAMLESFQHNMKQRDWRQLPTILASDTEQKDEDHVTLQLEVSKGEVTVAWYFRPDGKWGLQTIQFPNL